MSAFSEGTGSGVIVYIDSTKCMTSTLTIFSRKPRRPKTAPKSSTCPIIIWRLGIQDCTMESGTVAMVLSCQRTLPT
eukprot:643576-Amphidinium_carterae.1